MKTIDGYHGCKIKSTPDEILDEDPYKYSPNGIIEVDTGDAVTEILVQNLAIPGSDSKNYTEEDADAIFIKYAKQYIKKHINS